MTEHTTSRSSKTTQYRVLSGAIVVLLATAIALNIAALSMTAWAVEDQPGLLTEYPNALLTDDDRTIYSYEELHPSRPQGFTLYTGMRVGAFELCYTLTNPFNESNRIEKEACFPYRSEVEHRVVDRIVSNTLAMRYSVSLCELSRDNYVISFRNIGIPNDAMPRFLDGYCGFYGYATTVLQIGAIVAAVVAGGVWVSSNNHKVTIVAMIATCVGATLALATYVLWLGAFASVAGLSPGKSAHCTIASVVLLVVAAVVVQWSARFVQATTTDVASPMATSEPLV